MENAGHFSHNSRAAALPARRTVFLTAWSCSGGREPARGPCSRWSRLPSERATDQAIEMIQGVPPEVNAASRSGR